MRKIGVFVVLGVVGVGLYCWWTRPVELGPPPRVEWMQSVGPAMTDGNAALLAGLDGEVYLVDGVPNKSWKYFAARYSSEGGLAWRINLKTDFLVRPSMGADGCIYLADSGMPTPTSQVTRIRRDGTTQLVMKNVPMLGTSQFTIGSDGFAYFAGTVGKPGAGLPGFGKFEVNGARKFLTTDTGKPKSYFSGQDRLIPDGNGGVMYFAQGHPAAISRVDSTGKRAWTVKYVVSRDGQPLDCCVDRKGNTYVGGWIRVPSPTYTSGAWRGRHLFEQVRNWPAERRHRKSFGIDLFVDKYDIQGKRLWRIQPQTPVAEDDLRMTADGSGNVYVAGSMMDANVSSSGFVRKYDGQGNAVWEIDLGRALWAVDLIDTNGDGDVFVHCVHQIAAGKCESVIVKLRERGKR